MKQFRTLFIALALMIGATAFTNAQSKVAHIATQELVQSLPEYKSAMDQLDKLGKTYDAEIKDMLSEAQSTMQRYEAEANTKTDEENQKRATELQAAQKRIQDHSQQARQDLAKKRAGFTKTNFGKSTYRYPESSSR